MSFQATNHKTSKYPFLKNYLRTVPALEARRENLAIALAGQLSVFFCRALKRWWKVVVPIVTLYVQICFYFLFYISPIRIDPKITSSVCFQQDEKLQNATLHGVNAWH